MEAQEFDRCCKGKNGLYLGQVFFVSSGLLDCNFFTANDKMMQWKFKMQSNRCNGQGK